MEKVRPSATAPALGADHEQRRHIATDLVGRLRADLALAAEHGNLTDEWGFRLLSGHLGPQAVNPAACALIALQRLLHDATTTRRTAPVQDCCNGWAENDKTSCTQVALLTAIGQLSDELIDILIDGPWPI